MPANRIPRAIPTTRRSRLARLGSLASWALLVAILACVAAVLALAIGHAAPPSVVEPLLTPAEQAAFQAGREAAYVELAGAVSAAYEAGRRDAVAPEGATR